MRVAEIRVQMHPNALIPLASAIGAAVLASAIAAREPDRRANRLMGAVFLCVGVWSLCEVLWNMAPTAELAALYVRWSSLGSLMVGAFVMHLLTTSNEELAWHRRLLPAAYALCISATVVAIATEWVIVHARSTSWGWQAIPGPGLGVVYGMVAVLPVLASLDWLRRRVRDPAPLLRGRASRVAWAGVACFVVATLTDMVLPFSGYSAPRLGCATAVVWGAVTWWAIYRYRSAPLTPQKFAREILETLPDGVALVWLDGRIRTANRRLGELAGLPAEQLRGLLLSALLSEDPETPVREEGAHECELVHAGGTRIPVSVSTATIADDDGNAAGQVLVVRDLREVISLRSRIVASGRLLAVGQLAAGIAHEINNPIAYVGSNVRLLGEHWQKLKTGLGGAPRGPLVHEALAEGPELLRDAAEGIDRVARIVRDIGGFSRGGAVEPEVAQLTELLDTAARVAAPQLKQMRVERCFEEPPPVSCVPQELIQVFLNVLLNAGQACGGSGCIRLAARTQDGDALVEIADDGPGIAPEALERIFEPFFTTKPVGQGTGLGLAISQQIVSKHRGRLEVDSAPGHGTTFRIRLPVEPASGKLREGG